MIALTLAALAWLLVRTGTRPDRLRYPCQKASLDIVLLGAPLIGAIMGTDKFARDKKERKNKKIRWAILTAGIGCTVAVIFFHSYFLSFIYTTIKPELIYAQDSKSLAITELHPENPVSTVYGARAKGAGDALDRLLSVMKDKGMSLYQTSSHEGIIAANDTILIKVNAEWEQRGGTNTDLLKAFIRKIFEHPEGFSGEVVVVENGQWAIYLDSNRSNAEERTQSFRDVAEHFQDEGHKVSVLCNDGFDQHEGMVYHGLMGRMMAKVIYPDLNILDANYIGVSSRGPASSYESAYRANLILASKDPIALDWYAGKYVLYPLTGFDRHNPDNQNTSSQGRYPYNAFHQYLTTSLQELEKGGYELTMDQRKIETFIASVKG